MSNLNVIITGDKELDAAMAKFEVKIQKQGVRKATRAAAKHVHKEALNYVPVDTGALARSLKVRARKRSRASQGHQLEVKEPKGDAGMPWYGHLTEFGTDERFHKSGKSVGEVPEWPWMRMALYGSKASVQQLIITTLRQWLQAYKAKQPKK